MNTNGRARRAPLQLCKQPIVGLRNELAKEVEPACHCKDNRDKEGHPNDHLLSPFAGDHLDGRFFAGTHTLTVWGKGGNPPRFKNSKARGRGGIIILSFAL
ncbi:hypothetical protein [Bradyrhizobium sp. JYMT SZCCT0180]|uniref:hypothetical protein n=1 Tax=Bradyrhizobium sp. JYMT SZCCT0180 TaxID=2807666 RepID=UPI001BA79128|nr:hypothetical protein [Bradyrhizobium sp. JYMT SZCCT0180]MBR1213290.1 hypothetical protein [Bradyrhizobium sp. JYMT SZCCT0180]